MVIGVGFELLSPIHLLIVLFFFTMSVGLFAFWLWMLVDCLMNQKLQGSEKIVWVLVIVLLHWVGALIYLLVGRGKLAQKPHVSDAVPGNATNV